MVCPLALLKVTFSRILIGPAPLPSESAQRVIFPLFDWMLVVLPPPTTISLLAFKTIEAPESVLVKLVAFIYTLVPIKLISPAVAFKD